MESSAGKPTLKTCVFALLLCLILSDVTSGCPQGCHCAPKLTWCAYNNLTNIPKTIPSETEELYIKGNNIRYLPQGAFDHLPLLRTLHLTECNLESFSTSAISSLNKLVSLDLSANNLIGLDEGTFSGNLSVLRELTLDNNNISRIDDFAFRGLNLKTLGLEGNVFLEEISVHAFEGASVEAIYLFNSTMNNQAAEALKPLRQSLSTLSWQYNRIQLSFGEEQFKSFSFRLLDLSHNGIADTAFLKHVDTRILSLDSNPIGTIFFGRYSNLRHVRNLQLQNTGITFLHGQLFKRLSHLEELHLSNNNITKIRDNMKPVFDKLRGLTLEGNPLHCNCELLWFKHWLTTSNLRDVNAYCLTPHNERLVDVTEEEMACFAPTAVKVVKAHASSKEDNLVLTCTAQGDPAPWITWGLPEEHVISANEETSASLTETTSRLHITESDWTKGKNVSCLAENKQGNMSTVIHISTDAKVSTSKTTNSAEQTIASCFSKTVFSLLGAFLFTTILFL